FQPICRSLIDIPDKTSSIQSIPRAYARKFARNSSLGSSTEIVTVVTVTLGEAAGGGVRGRDSCGFQRAKSGVDRWYRLAKDNQFGRSEWSHSRAPHQSKSLPRNTR